MAVAPGFGEVRAVEINRRLAEAAEEHSIGERWQIGTLWKLADMFRIYIYTMIQHYNTVSSYRYILESYRILVFLQLEIDCHRVIHALKHQTF